MSAIMELIDSLRGSCECGLVHETSIRDIQIGSGMVHRVGEILKKNSFPKQILLVADRNTLKAADGILESLQDFSVEQYIYDNLRVADMKHVQQLEALVQGRDVGILSVGTGSVNDPCRLAAARQNKMLCIFGTAPSMDGFASYSSPLVENGFKASYPAKSPEVVIGDTKILADAGSSKSLRNIFNNLLSTNTVCTAYRIACSEIFHHRANENVSANVGRLSVLGKFAIAVVYHYNRVGRGLLDYLNCLFNLVDSKALSLCITAATLNCSHLNEGL